MTIPVDRRLHEAQNDPPPFQQHDVPVGAQHGSCRFHQDALDCESVTDLKKTQCTDIAGTGNDLSIMGTYPIDEDIN